MRRPIRLPAALCALIVCAGLAVAAASAGARSVANHAKACSSAPAGSLAGGYYLKLLVKGVGCASGRSVQSAWQACRLKHGQAGRCSATVVGFKCHEVRQAIPTLITARVSCKKGGRTVSYSYQQNIG